MSDNTASSIRAEKNELDPAYGYTMSRHFLDAPRMDKNVQFAFRVESSLREQFVYICKGIDRPAGQVLREFMRSFVRENIQTSLFNESTDLRNQSQNLEQQE